MFSVYGVTGKVFTGTVEQLRHIDKVNALARLRRIEPNDLKIPPDQTVEGLPGGFFGGSGGNAGAGAAPTSSPVRSALAAYATATVPDAPRQPLDRVDLLMTQPAITVRADATLGEASALLSRHHIGQMPVVDALGRLVGLLLRADLFRPQRAAAAVAPPPSISTALSLTGAEATSEPAAPDWDTLMAQPVSELMWTPVPSVSADTDIRRVARVLLDTALPGLPVVDDAGGVTGFVSRTDILRAVASDPPLDVWG